MPKQKPCKGLVKRVRITRNGKVVSISSGSGHRKSRKSTKRNRMLKRGKPLSKVAAKMVRNLFK